MADLGVKTRLNGIFDSELELKDAGLVAASAAAQVDSAAVSIDVGTGHFKGMVEIEVTALEIASNDEIYDIVVQGSTVAAFATDTAIWELAQLSLGAAETKRTDANGDSTTGRYKIYFDNETDGIYCRYLRLYTVVAGTIATGINYTAFITQMNAN
jgi:hypothetical protein